MKAVTLSAMLLSLWTCVWGRELLWVGGKNSDMCDAANWIDQATGLAPSGRAATSEADHDTLVFENAKPGALTKGGTLRVDGLMMRGSELDVSSANDYVNSIYFNVGGCIVSNEAVRGSFNLDGGVYFKAGSESEIYVKNAGVTHAFSRGTNNKVTLIKSGAGTLQIGGGTGSGSYSHDVVKIRAFHCIGYEPCIDSEPEGRFHVCERHVHFRQPGGPCLCRPCFWSRCGSEWRQDDVLGEEYAHFPSWGGDA